MGFVPPPFFSWVLFSFSCGREGGGRERPRVLCKREEEEKEVNYEIARA